jgi:hypothetical protein
MTWSPKFPVIPAVGLRTMLSWRSRPRGEANSAFIKSSCVCAGPRTSIPSMILPLRFITVPRLSATCSPARSTALAINIPSLLASRSSANERILKSRPAKGLKRFVSSPNCSSVKSRGWMSVFSLRFSEVKRAVSRCASAARSFAAAACSFALATANPVIVFSNVCNCLSETKTKPSNTNSPETPITISNQPNDSSSFFQFKRCGVMGRPVRLSTSHLVRPWKKCSNSSMKSWNTSGPSIAIPIATTTVEASSKTKYWSRASARDFLMPVSSAEISMGDTAIASDDQNTRVLIHTLTILAILGVVLIAEIIWALVSALRK